MPSTIFPEIERNTNGVDESRALQALALDLSLLGLGTQEDDSPFDGPSRMKSSNTTECVPVPSSEHVAEIVGRQGCKIKALRAKTNTYIKTPVRGDDPVFVVTGRKEDVLAAKREILQAAEHFSQIRARRSQGQLGPGLPGQPPPAIPGQTTLQVRVPYRVVGLVVGPKGATIKRIQQQTNTYIVTPSRDNEPVFEVTGLPENVERAKEEIEAHIAMRTGGQLENDKGQDDFATNGTDTGTFHNSGPAEMSVFTPIGPFNPMVGSNGKEIQQRSNSITTTNSSDAIFNANNTSKYIFSQLFNNSVNRENSFYDMVSPDVIPDPGFEQHQTLQSQVGSNLWQEVNRYPDPFNTALGPQRAHSFGSESQLDNSDDLTRNHKPAVRLHSDPLRGGRGALSSALGPFLPSNGSMSSGSSEGSIENSPSSDSSSSGSSEASKKCTMCEDKEIIAALVPCGHNLFCMDCANNVTEKEPKECPVCHEIVTQAIRIIS